MCVASSSGSLIGEHGDEANVWGNVWTILQKLTKTCTHTQSGLTALKVAQSEAHQDICDILRQYSKQGAKVTTPERCESRQVEERKADLAEVGMDDRATDARWE